MKKKLNCQNYSNKIFMLIRHLETLKVMNMTKTKNSNDSISIRLTEIKYISLGYEIDYVAINHLLHNQTPVSCRYCLQSTNLSQTSQ